MRLKIFGVMALLAATIASCTDLLTDGSGDPSAAVSSKPAEQRFSPADMPPGSADNALFGTSSTASSPTTSIEWQVEQQIHMQINQHRRQLGLDTLRSELLIGNVSREHSQNMANGTVAFGHSGFSNRVYGMRTQLRWYAAAENVAYSSYQDASTIATRLVTGWLNSSGHRRNIEDPRFNRTGVGVARNASGRWYATQIFLYVR